MRPRARGGKGKAARRSQSRTLIVQYLVQVTISAPFSIMMFVVRFAFRSNFCAVSGLGWPETAQFHRRIYQGDEGTSIVNVALKAQVIIMRFRIALNLVKYCFIRRTP